jgi:hypothetical protein
MGQKIKKKEAKQTIVLLRATQDVIEGFVRRT